ncbi:MAG TPA: toxin [Desulfobacterales bacterium]|nr:toxin [Desulfobacterales bacterium]
MALIDSRGICFEDVVFHIEKGDLLDDYQHPNQKKYAGQRIMVVGINNYAYLIPYVEDNDEIFLKTIIPSRKATERYFGGKHED